MDDATIEVLKNQLTALEGGIKNLSNEIDDEETAPTSKTEIQILLEVLSNLHQQANSTLIKLEGYTKPLTERRGTLTRAYVDTTVKLKDLMEEIEPERQGPPSMEQTFQQASGRADHLPRLDLPKFSGNPTEWLSFKGRFEKRIANINEDADKYAFLIKCLEDFDLAKHNIEAMENSGMKFSDSWTKLEQRCYKKRIAFEGYFFKIIRFKKITSPSARAIMALIDAVDTAVHASKQIEGQGTTALDCVANGLLVTLVKSKLDTETLEKIEDNMDMHKTYTWLEFKEELEKRTSQMASQFSEVAEKSKTSKTVAAIASASAAEKARPSSPKPSGSKPSKSRAQTIECHFCNKNHSIWYCGQFKRLPYEERKAHIINQHRCLNCFFKGHSNRNCTSTKMCLECGKKHHTLLHADKPTEATQQAVPAIMPAPANQTPQQ